MFRQLLFLTVYFKKGCADAVIQKVAHCLLLSATCAGKGCTPKRIVEPANDGSSSLLETLHLASPLKVLRTAWSGDSKGWSALSYYCKPGNRHGLEWKQQRVECPGCDTASLATG